jgi:hypothetical protein
MPRYVFSLAVGGQQYITDEHGIELDTLYDVQTKALRILEQAFPFAPDHLRACPRASESTLRWRGLLWCATERV